MLPSQIMVSELGSFAESTIRHRKPQIIATVLATNDYPAAVVDALGALADEIAAQPVAPLAAWPVDEPWWCAAWEAADRSSWFALPWYFAEAYFYRRLLEAVRYDEPGPLYQRDPFAPQKRASLPAALASLESVAAQLAPEAASAEVAPATALQLWLRRCLWGNRADLSNQTVAIDRHHYAGEDDGERLVIDDTAAIVAHLLGGDVGRLDLVADNSGPELCADLVLLDHVLHAGLVTEVRLHLKSLPFFVSDAMVADVSDTLAALRASAVDAVRQLADRLTGYLSTGQLTLRAHGAWASPLCFDALPADLVAELAAADLVLFKGDANYRRVLLDRHWAPTTDVAEITRHIPTSFALLRTLKSELVAGLVEGQPEALAAQDANWLLNGERGVIQLVWRG